MGIDATQIKYQSVLADVPTRPSTRAIFLLDIFSGTGQQIKDWWKSNESLLLPWSDKSVELILGILVLNCKAAVSLKSIPTNKEYVSYLGERYNVLSRDSKIFTTAEKELIKSYCRRTNCPSEYVYGRGNCGLLVSFKYGCPNNSLPILWYNSKRWNQLFKRYAI